MNGPFDVSTILLGAINRYQFYKSRNTAFAKVARRYYRIKHFIFSVITGSDIHPNATLGLGLRLPHPNGVVVHADAIIGDDCLIMQQVTIGQLADDDAPVIGARVYIGAGAKVLGRIKVGDKARVGANSVVLIDVPPGRTAVGVPAKVVPLKDS